MAALSAYRGQRSRKEEHRGAAPRLDLPDSCGANPAVVQAATGGTKDEQDSAKRTLKKLLLEEFRKKATPGEEFFGGFYPAVKVINKALG